MDSNAFWAISSSLLFFQPSQPVVTGKTTRTLFSSRSAAQGYLLFSEDNKHQIIETLLGWVGVCSYKWLHFNCLTSLEMVTYKTVEMHPGCQRLFMCGFWFQSSLKRVTHVKRFSRAFSHGFTARFFGQRPKTCQTGADKAPWYPL